MQPKRKKPRPHWLRAAYVNPYWPMHDAHVRAWEFDLWLRSKLVGDK